MNRANTLIACVCVLIPFVTFADTLSDLQARLSSLLSQIENIKTQSAVSSSASATISFTQSLRIGSRGADVEALQTLLKQKGYYNYPTITGYYGLVTARAVSAYQSANGLEPVGFVGPRTRALLNASVRVSSPTPSVPITVSTPTPTTIFIFRGGGGGGGSVNPTPTPSPSPTVKITPTPISTPTPTLSATPTPTQLQTVTPTPTPSPLAVTFAINDQTNLTLNVGDTMLSVWSTTNGTSVSSTFTEDSSSCGLTGTGPFPWAASTLSGATSSPAFACYGGHSYVITLVAKNTAGQTATATVNVHFNAALIPTDAQLNALPSAGISWITVKDYWPWPAPGKVRISEFSVRGSPYEVFRYRNAGNGNFYLEAYQIKPDRSLVWLNTWVLTVATDGTVNEIIDSTVDLNAPSTWEHTCATNADGCWVSNQTAQPINHGSYLEVGKWVSTINAGTMYRYPSMTRLPDFSATYSINPIDVKTRVDLPGGTFNNVMVQDEVQMPSYYRFYYALGIGIIAQQYHFDSTFNVALNPEWFIYLSKTCETDENSYLCP